MISVYQILIEIYLSRLTYKVNQSVYKLMLTSLPWVCLTLISKLNSCKIDIDYTIASMIFFYTINYSIIIVMECDLFKLL